MSFKNEENKLKRLLEKDIMTDEQFKKARAIHKKLKPTNEEQRMRKQWLGEALFLFDVVV